MVDESATLREMGRDPKGKGLSPNQHFFRGCVGFLKGIYEKLLQKKTVETNLTPWKINMAFAVSFREGSRENDKPEPSFFSVHHQNHSNSQLLPRKPISFDSKNDGTPSSGYLLF